MEKIENEDWKLEGKEENQIDNEVEEIVELSEEQEQEVEGGASVYNPRKSFKEFWSSWNVMNKVIGYNEWRFYIRVQGHNWVQPNLYDGKFYIVDKWGVQFRKMSGAIVFYEEVDRGGIRPIWEAKLMGRKGNAWIQLDYVMVNKSRTRW